MEKNYQNPSFSPKGPPFVSFSSLGKDEKREYVVDNNFNHGDRDDIKALLKSFDHPNQEYQKLFDEFSENTIASFNIPLGILPGLVLNNVSYDVPLAIEESSVVAAASKSAKIWSQWGGVFAKVVSFQKKGHVHFLFSEPFELLTTWFYQEGKALILEKLAPLEHSMKQRGGGISDIKLINKNVSLKNYGQLEMSVDTCDAMGANFINTLLEEAASLLKIVWPNINIVFSILSNYVPDCVVKSWVCVSKEVLDSYYKEKNHFDGFCEKFITALDIARVDIHRATTHNKGILNGIDAVALATGNDFRATEASLHAFATRFGQYQSLTKAIVNEDNDFIFEFEGAFSIGVIGGLTQTHPMAKFSLALLRNPSAKELMQIAAAVGLMQNFAAVSSLITTGIQKGHMKLHLINILSQLKATDEEKKRVKQHFIDKKVSFSSVKSYLDSLRCLH